MNDVLKVLAILWAVVSFAATAAFFAGGEWQTWNKVKTVVINNPPTMPSMPFGFKVSNDQLVQINGNLDVLGNRWEGEVIRVTAGKGEALCPEGTYVVGMRGIDDDGGGYCTECLTRIEFVCRKL